MMKKILIAIFVALSLTGVAQGDSVSLVELYKQMALAYNHDLKIAERSITISSQYESMARADKKPKVAAGANFTYSGNPMELTLALPSMDQPMTFSGQNMQYGASVSILQPVYTGGRLNETLRMARLQNSEASYQRGYVYSAVCYQTDVQYWSAVARAEMVGVARDQYAAIDTLTRRIEGRVEAGLIDPQELLMARVKLNEAQYQLLQAEANLKTSIMALNSLIGVDLDAPTRIESRVEPIVQANQLIESDGNVRDEVLIAQDRIKMAESTLKLNDAKYKPQIYVGADGSYGSPGYNFNPDLNLNYALYTKISIPILEWGKRHSEKRASNLRIDSSTDKLSQVEDAVALEIRSSKVALDEATRRVALAESSLDIARENERKAAERYAEGKISVIEVIDAQLYRQTSQVNFVQAKLSAQSHKAELIRALNLSK